MGMAGSSEDDYKGLIPDSFPLRHEIDWKGFTGWTGYYSSPHFLKENGVT
jgi:hypothetical protein